MAKKETRFHVIKAGDDAFCADAQIWIDKKTGVNYLFVQNGYAGGLTALLDRDGRPVVSPLPLVEE
jgi:hypothetical protein